MNQGGCDSPKTARKSKRRIMGKILYAGGTGKPSMGFCLAGQRL